MKNWNPTLMLALFIAVTFVAAGLGAFFTNTSLRNWYPTIRKPSCLSRKAGFCVEKSSARSVLGVRVIAFHLPMI